MRYEVLGPVEARLDDVVLTVGGPQQRRLLALFLSRPGQSFSTDRLVDCLWPDGMAPDGAARSVMTYVSRLRAALGDSSISTAQEGYRLDLNGSVLDSQQFEDWLSEAGTIEPGRAVELYDRALALWRGCAYGEFGAEWWLLAEARRLDELRIVAMEERAEALLALGHHHHLIPELTRLSTDNPVRERPVSLMMQALFATGRHADALRAFQSFRTRLADETGLDPSAELVALERTMAAGRPLPNLNTRARLLRGYTIHQVLGEGAFGRVFAATQPGTNRQVAIKAIRPDLSNSPEFIQRFEAEAQLVARLEHPHIVPLYDYWREPAGAYLVFRLLLGGTAFGECVINGPFSVARVSRLVEEVGSALLAAHTAGVVHCDVKPSNVLFDEGGNAYLSDFGIAVTSSIADRAGDRTRAYAAPELTDRTGDTIQSDIFSFGCMLWELLVGASPFTQMLPTNQFRLPSLAGALSEPCEALDAVLAKATTSAAGSRFQSMAELIVAWREAVGRPEGVLSPLSPLSDTEPSSSRRRAVRALSSAMSSAVNPYKGLRAFGEADAGDFFGRDDVTAALHDTLQARRFVAVVGPSGSGKSSLVHAGLVPLLRRDGVRVATMVPGDRPSDALRQAMQQVAATDSDTHDPAELFKQAVSDGAGPLALIVDQFEECWTLADASERERFLSAVVVAGRCGIQCVTTVRADLYDRPLQHALIGQLVADGTFALPPLSVQALEEVVVRPAERHGVDFDDGVVTTIVAEANAQPAGLPLLQFAMAEMYERRVDDHVTANTLKELGGLGGAIGRRAEDVYASLDDEMQAHARQLFGRLVAPGHGAPDTRRRARFGELSEPDRLVADCFVRARLLVADRDLATREPVVEIAHEALLTNWPRQREWLDADRRWLAQLQHLAMATRSWDEAGRPDGELYRGSRLEAVIEAFPEREQQLSDDEHAFIVASRTARDADQQRERRRSRRLRRLLVTTSCVLVLAVIAGAIAVNQGRHARTSRRESQIEALVGRSLSLRATQRDAAALLAVEAFRLADTPRTRSALLSTFTASPGVLGIDHLPESLGKYTNGIVLPDGETALVIGVDQRFHSYDLDTGDVGEPWPPLSAGPYIFSRLFSSADGRLVGQMAWADDIRHIGVYDTATHALVVGPIPVFDTLDSAIISPDNSRVFASGDDTGNVFAYSIPDGNKLGELPGIGKPDDSPLIATTAGLAFVNGGLLAVGSVLGPVRLVDPDTLTEVRRIDAPRGTSELLTAIDGGAGLIGDGLTGTIRLDVESGSTVWHLTENKNPGATWNPCAVVETTNRLYCGDTAGRLEERDLETGGLIHELDAQSGSAGALWIARQGTELVSFADEDHIVSRWRLDGSGLVSRRVSGTEGFVPDTYSPDGRLLIGYSDQGFYDTNGSEDPAVFDVATGKQFSALDGLNGADWRNDQELIGVSRSGDTTFTIDTYDLASAALHPTDIVIPENDWITIFGSRHWWWLQMAAGDDGAGHGKSTLWAIDKDTLKRDTTIPLIDSAFYGTPGGSDDGERVALITSTGVAVVDGRTGRPIGTITGIPYRDSTFLSNATITANHRLIVSSLQGDLTIYDVDTLKPLRTLSGTRGFNQVKADADGRLAMVTGGDRSVTLYDVDSGEQIGDRIIIPGTEPRATALRPDGLEMAIGGGINRDILVWDLNPEHWTTAACKVAGRNLTREEWDTYLGGLGDYRSTCPDSA